MNGINEQKLDKARELRDIPGSCKACWGSGKITNADEDEGEYPEPWPIWDALEGLSRLSITMGLVRPVDCTKCSGTGKVG